MITITGGEGDGGIPERLKKSVRLPKRTGNFCSRKETPSGSVGSRTRAVAPSAADSAVLLDANETGRCHFTLGLRNFTIVWIEITVTTVLHSRL